MMGQIGYAAAFGGSCVGFGIALAWVFMMVMGWR